MNLLNSPKLFYKFKMANADITKYSTIKLDCLFCIIVIISFKEQNNFIMLRRSNIKKIFIIISLK
jgi:hypothetical protein